MGIFFFFFFKYLKIRQREDPVAWWVDPVALLGNDGSVLFHVGGLSLVAAIGSCFLLSLFFCLRKYQSEPPTFFIFLNFSLYFLGVNSDENRKSNFWVYLLQIGV